jgi:hypothetical protein
MLIQTSRHFLPPQPEFRQVFPQPVGVVGGFLPLPRDVKQFPSRLREVSRGAADAKHFGQLRLVENIQIIGSFLTDNVSQVIVLDR